jgi:hypothetical protein
MGSWRLFRSAFVGAFVVAVAPAFLVVAFDRSACYTFVILLVSLNFLRGDKEAALEYLAALLLANNRPYLAR